MSATQPDSAPYARETTARPQHDGQVLLDNSTERR